MKRVNVGLELVAEPSLLFLVSREDVSCGSRERDELLISQTLSVKHSLHPAHAWQQLQHYSTHLDGEEPSSIKESACAGWAASRLHIGFALLCRTSQQVVLTALPASWWYSACSVLRARG